MKIHTVTCYFCDKRFKRQSFDVVIGALAFFLCEKHQVELDNFIKERS